MDGLLIFILLVAHVIVVKRAAGIIPLQRAAIGRVVARGRQRQAGVVRQLKYVLNQALSKARFTDYEAASVILNGARDNL